MDRVSFGEKKMRKKSILVWAIASLSLGLFSESATALDWAIQVVPNATSDYFASLAVDSEGNPRIAYRNPTSNYALSLAVYNNSSWNILTADGQNPGEHLALALNSSGSPRIAYGGDRDAKYAAWNGWSWDLGTIADISPKKAYSFSMTSTVSTDLM